MNFFGQRLAIGVLTLVIGCLPGLEAHAEQGHGHGPAAFTDFDVNGDGSISESEFNSVREQRMAARAAEGRQMRCAAQAPSFADLDTDDNGRLSAEELTAGQKAHMEKCRATHDQNDAGMGGHHHMPVFTDFDTDGNGMISEQELDAARAKRMDEMAGRGQPMKHAGNMPSFADIDANGDGGISEKEFDEYHAARRAQMQQMHEKQQMPQKQH